MRSVLSATTFLALSIFSAGADAQNTDLLLVLAADVSRSIDEGEFELQRKGYAAALTDPRVLGAIRSGTNGTLAVCFVEWSGVWVMATEGLEGSGDHLLNESFRSGWSGPATKVGNRKDVEVAGGRS